jgi:thiamine-phosphate pyrophosphorylase
MNRDKAISLLSSGLYCITAEEHSRGKTNIEVVRQMIDAGVRVVQYREKDKSSREKFHECVRIREMTMPSGAVFIVNDDPGLALAVEADGVHIGQDDMPIEAVRRICGGMIIGLSTHSPEQARDAVSRGADYIGVGPIYRTFTKKNVCDPVGLEYLDYAVKNVTIPFVAIGGIKEHNLEEVLSCGARTVCLVTEITGAEDIGEIVKRITSAINSHEPFHTIIN